MADYWPAANGNWSTLSNWLTAVGVTAGSLPGPADDVYADSRTVTMDINATARQIATTTRAGGLAGGGFRAVSGQTYTANFLAGTTDCLTFLSASPAFCNIVGNLSASSTAGTLGALVHTGTGTVNITGSIFGHPVNVTFSGNVRHSGGGTINMVGNIVGGLASGSAAAGVYTNTIILTNSSVLNLTGNVLGPSATTNDFTGQTNQAVILNGGTLNMVGDVIARQANIAGSGGFGITLTTSLNNLNIRGNVTGGGSQCVGVFVSTTTLGSTVTITGNVSGGIVSSTNSTGLIITASSSNNPTITINGNVVGSQGTGLLLNHSGNNGSLTVNGDVFGGAIGNGVNYNSSTNVNTFPVNINGRVVGGVVTGLVNNQSNQRVYARTVVGAPGGLGATPLGTAVGISNIQNGLVYCEQAEFGVRGATPVSGPIYILPSNRNTLTGYTTALGTPVTFYNSLSIDGLLPPVSSVQAGTVYNVGNSVGTMAVPSASAVQFGVPVDNTVGTAALQPQDVWGYARLSATQVDSMGDRLRNTATTQSIGYQIASFNL